MKDVELKVGLPLTYCIGTDYYPYEVSKIFDENHICIRPLDYKVLSGTICDENAKIEFSSNPERKELEIKHYKDGWHAVMTKANGSKVKSSTRYSLSFGEARKYCDPSF